MPIEVIDETSRVWKPSPRQEEFIRLPKEVDEGFYGGAAGGGKSEVLLMYPVVKQWYKHPRFKGIIFRRTFPQLEESLIPRSQEYYPALGGVYNEAKHVWKFPSGATIRFGYMEREQDARAHDTAEYNYLAFDELTHFTEFQYTYLACSRVRTSSPDLPAVTRSASNPGNIGHSWVRARFVEPQPLGGVILRDPKTNTRRIFIRALLTDNPYLMESDPNYINKLRGLPEAEYKAKAEGDWWTFYGQVFTEWRYLRYPSEPANALHVIPADPSLHLNWWPKILAVDWGYSAMTYACWLAISPDDRVFMYREYGEKKKSIQTWASEIARASQFDQNIRVVIIDPSANKSDGHEKTIKQQFIDASGFGYVEDADNDRHGGKMLMHDYLRWTPKPPRYVPAEGFRKEVFEKVFRRSGAEAALEYRKMFDPEPAETNIPILQVFDNCPKFANAISLCVYDERDKEDVAEFEGDDPYDAGRYGIKAAYRYMNQKGEFERRARQAEIINRLHQTGDMTEFYRSMEQFESANTSKVVAIRRRGGARRTSAFGR